MGCAGRKGKRHTATPNAGERGDARSGPTATTPGASSRRSSARNKQPGTDAPRRRRRADHNTPLTDAPAWSWNALRAGSDTLTAPATARVGVVRAAAGQLKRCVRAHRWLVSRLPPPNAHPRPRPVAGAVRSLQRPGPPRSRRLSRSMSRRERHRTNRYASGSRRRSTIRPAAALKIELP